MRTPALKVGLTGGIGSGKSLALAELSRQGAMTLSLDDVARSQARPGMPVHKAMIKAFGTADRRALAGIVFKSPQARRRLERLTHPPILREMRRWLANAKGVAVVDVPLLFEGRYQEEFDVTVSVEAPRAARLRRVSRRDGARATDVRRRMAAQLSDQRRAALADVVWRNDGAKTDFKKRVREYYRAFDLLRRGAQTARESHS